MGLIIHVDGGARGNPGPAGAGVVIADDSGQPIYEAAFFLGRQTSNAAEYHALIRALEHAGRLAERPVAIYSDSQLLVRQITGEYRVKSAGLAPLFRQAQMLLLKLAPWTIQHIPRTENLRADELANLAMDGRRDQVLIDADGGVDACSEPVSAPGPGASAASLPTHEDSGPDAAPVAASAAVHVTVSRQPEADCCPAGGECATGFVIGPTLPAGLCVHAAHAILPTALAIMNTDPLELAAVPTMTVRCNQPGCRAEFQIAPQRSGNGVPPTVRPAR